MNNNGVPKIMLNYRPNGRRQLGRTFRTLLDEAETDPSIITDDDDDADHHHHHHHYHYHVTNTHNSSLSQSKHKLTPLLRPVNAVWGYTHTVILTSI
jgi:hypothetical protein